jgi:hypothetical protein
MLSLPSDLNSDEALLVAYLTTERLERILTAFCAAPHATWDEEIDVTYRILRELLLKAISSLGLWHLRAFVPGTSSWLNSFDALLDTFNAIFPQSLAALALERKRGEQVVDIWDPPVYRLWELEWRWRARELRTELAMAMRWQGMPRGVPPQWQEAFNAWDEVIDRYVQQCASSSSETDLQAESVNSTVNQTLASLQGIPSGSPAGERQPASLPRHVQRKRERQAQARELRKQGALIKEIARRFGVSERAVQGWLQEQESPGHVSS